MMVNFMAIMFYTGGVALTWLYERDNKRNMLLSFISALGWPTLVGVYVTAHIYKWMEELPDDSS